MRARRRKHKRCGEDEDNENECHGKVAKTSTMSMNAGKMGTPQINNCVASTCITRMNDSVASTLCGENDYDENECRGKVARMTNRI